MQTGRCGTKSIVDTRDGDEDDDDAAGPVGEQEMNVIDPNLTDTGEYAPVDPIAPGQIRVSAAGKTDVGRVRSNNEDHFLIGRVRRTQEIVATNLEPELMPELREEIGHAFVIADGMGGMASGEEASRLAIVTGLELVRDAGKWHFDVDDPDEATELRATLLRYFQQVNRRVYRQAATNAAFEGMGTTLTVAYAVGLRLFVAHVGDSRAYLYHGGLLQQLTRDHTVAQELANAGRIAQSEVKTHRMRNVLTHYIGSPDDGLMAEFHRLELADGDRLLLCSDGLSDFVEDKAIAAVLTAEPTPEAACLGLINRANAGGGRDNITAVVANFRVEPG